MLWFCRHRHVLKGFTNYFPVNGYWIATIYMCRVACDENVANMNLRLFDNIVQQISKTILDDNIVHVRKFIAVSQT